MRLPGRIKWRRLEKCLRAMQMKWRIWDLPCAWLPDPAHELWVWFDVSEPQAETKGDMRILLAAYWTWELSVIQTGRRIFSSLLFGSNREKSQGTAEPPGSWRVGVCTLGITWRADSCCPPSAGITESTGMWPLRDFSFGGHWLCKLEKKNLRSTFVDSCSLRQEPKMFGHYPCCAPLCIFMQVTLEETCIIFATLIQIVVILDSPSKTDPDTRAGMQAVYLGSDSEKWGQEWTPIPGYVIKLITAVLVGLDPLSPSEEPHGICLIYPPALIPH